jgi:HD-like signal output (HDOD) protein
MPQWWGGLSKTGVAKRRYTQQVGNIQRVGDRVMVSNGKSFLELIDEQIRSDAIEVPMLPEVASKAIRLANDPESDAARLAKLIQSDQMLAGQVMRIANSALYTPGSSLVSLQQAIARLGMKTIADIALAASVNAKMFNAPGYERHIQVELQFSLMAGLWAKEVARACRRNVEASFLAGLLHDIGRPVCIQLVIETAKRCQVEISASMMMELEQHFQRSLGITVVHQWDMPTLVKDVVMWFDDYTNAGKSAEQTMIVVAGAEFSRCFYKEVPVRKKITRDQLVKSPVLAELNLYPDDIAKLIDKAPLVLSTMEMMSQ